LLILRLYTKKLLPTQSLRDVKIYKLRVPNYFMKIMKVVDKKIGDKTYFKYRINIPVKIAEDSNLLEKEVKIKLEGEKITVEKE
jgi:hypothetical protein